MGKNNQHSFGIQNPDSIQVTCHSIDQGGSLSALRPFERAESTHIICIIGLVISWATSIVCIAISVHKIIHSDGRYGSPLDIQGFYRIFLPLILNIFIALCTDILGYIHSVSLRWVLWKEGRLLFNSSSRLFTSSRSVSNSWYINILWAACLVISYAATSQLLILSKNFANSIDNLPGGSAKPETIILNSIALAALGIGILGQAMISTWCMLRTSKYIRTWSSNPLNTTLACLYRGLTHRPGRCMLAVHSAHLPSTPSMPTLRQLSAGKANRSVRYILLFIWFLFPLTVIWGYLIYHYEWSRDDFNHSLVRPSDFNPKTQGLDLLPFPYSDNVSINPPLVRQFVYVFLILVGIQAFQTMGLHSVELLVNFSRDELIWRRANAGVQPLARISTGADISSSSFKAVITSWQSLVLFALKPIIHWLFGLCITTSRGAFYSVPYGSAFEIVVAHSAIITMRYVPIFTLAAVSLFLAVFATYLARRQPSGPQPATYGHLQTLADLIDDWHVGEDAKLWWGDKGVANGNIRHTGTSAQKEKIGDIRMGCLYA